MGRGHLCVDDRNGGARRVVEESGDAGPEGGRVYTFNSTELRMLHVEMVLVPPVGGVPLATVQPSAVRPPARGAAQKARETISGLLYRKQPVVALPPARLWEITAGSENLILLWCFR